MNRQASTAAVAAQSVRLSVAVALSASEPNARAKARLKANRNSLTAIAAASTRMSASEKPPSCGEKMLCTDCAASSAATARMSTATMSAATGSARLCPKGCSLSAGLPLTRKPISDTVFDPQSVRLLMPSASTEIMPDTAPSAIFAPASSRLHAMPSTPEKTPARVRAPMRSARSSPRRNSLPIRFMVSLRARRRALRFFCIPFNLYGTESVYSIAQNVRGGNFPCRKRKAPLARSAASGARERHTQRRRLARGRYRAAGGGKFFYKNLPAAVLFA